MGVVGMGSDESQLFVRIPKSLKYLVDQDDRTNKELVTAALETELGVSADDSVAVVERRIKRLEDRLESEKSELESKQNRLRDIKTELERARDIKQQKADEQGNYQERLDSILDRMVDADDDLQHVPAQHGVIDELRTDYDKTNEEIHYDLKQLAAQQARNIPVAAFMQPRFADPQDERTLIADHWQDDAINSEDDSNE